MSTLSVWLHGEHLAQLEQLRTSRLRLRFTDAALDRWGVGARPLSLSLPLTERRVQGDALERFCDNLLPEGGVRAVLERENDIRPGDTFALLSRIGRECAGAIQFTTDEAPAGAGRVTPLTSDEVDVLVRDLPTHHVPDGLAVSASLGGVQDKVLLTRTADGWAWPADGAMSSHLVKPQPQSPQAPIPDIIRYEHWALQVAAAAGLRAARSELEWFGDRQALVVERFDRHGGRRIHQEDFTQSLALASRDKHESSVGERRLAALATRAAAEAADPQQLLTELLAQVTFNAAIGNGDAHSKNYSIQISRAATVSMSPLYDVAPVFLVAPTYRHAGHAVNEQVYLPYITTEHLVAEACEWGLGADVAAVVVRQTLLAIAEAVENLGEPADTPVAVGRAVLGRVRALAG
ncbi:toxin HipA [Cellulomonas chitinilytica]|uniref:Toxin HipA n=1 Tax=Cellulomonas chitinilytica TaxID=398759 RepID=A0A919P039_9CELL|nr:HipA domain-containing protein [Cellulomonas chitinilytica]GIG20891.1 toxin HipA [Cellulomonas chitinilytica]